MSRDLTQAFAKTNGLVVGLEQRIQGHIEALQQQDKQLMVSFRVQVLVLRDLKRELEKNKRVRIQHLSDQEKLKANLQKTTEEFSATWAKMKPSGDEVEQDTAQLLKQYQILFDRKKSITLALGQLDEALQKSDSDAVVTNTKITEAEAEQRNLNKEQDKVRVSLNQLQQKLQELIAIAPSSAQAATSTAHKTKRRRVEPDSSDQEQDELPASSVAGAAVQSPRHSNKRKERDHSAGSSNQDTNGAQASAAADQTRNEVLKMIGCQISYKSALSACSVSDINIPSQLIIAIKAISDLITHYQSMQVEASAHSRNKPAAVVLLFAIKLVLEFRLQGASTEGAAATSEVVISSASTSVSPARTRHSGKRVIEMTAESFVKAHQDLGQSLQERVRRWKLPGVFAPSPYAGITVGDALDNNFLPSAFTVAPG